MLYSLALRVNRRTAVTIVGVAVAVMFLMGSSILISGLQVGSERLRDRFTDSVVLAYKGDDLLKARVTEQEISQLDGEFEVLRSVSARVAISGKFLDVVLVSRYPLTTNGSKILPAVKEGEILLGQNVAALIGSDILAKGTPLTVSAFVTFALSYGGTFARSVPLPDDWALVSDNVTRTLDPLKASEYTFLLLPATNVDAQRQLEAQDFNLIYTAGSLEFYAKGVSRLSIELNLFIAASGVVIVLLVFYSLGLEVAQRSRELRILKQLGASPSQVLGLYTLRSAFLGISGGIIGMAAGVVLASAIISLSPLLGLSNLVLITFDPWLGGQTLLLCTGASMLGGLVPTLRAFRAFSRGV